MCSKVFINFNSAGVLIKGQSIDKKFNIKIEDYENKKELDSVCNFILKHLLSCQKYFDIVLILGENFWTFDLNRDNNTSSFIEDNIISSKRIPSFNKDMVNIIMNLFSKGNNRVVAVLPSLFFIENYFEKDEEIIISVCRNSSFITVLTSEYNLNHIIRLPLGTNNICEDLSNIFNLPLDYSKTLFRRCGYVYVPENLIDYSVDIPVSKDYLKTIDMAELSSQIRNSLSRILENIFYNINRNIPKKKAESGYIVNFDTYINGLSKYMYNNVNEEIVVFRLDKVAYDFLTGRYEQIQKIFISGKEEKCIIEKTINNESEEQIIKCNLKEKITEKVNTFINGFLTAITE